MMKIEVKSILSYTIPNLKPDWYNSVKPKDLKDLEVKETRARQLQLAWSTFHKPQFISKQISNEEEEEEQRASSNFKTRNAKSLFHIRLRQNLCCLH